jgi:hypothetical protein
MTDAREIYSNTQGNCKVDDLLLKKGIYGEPDFTADKEIYQGSAVKIVVFQSDRCRA